MIEVFITNVKTQIQVEKVSKKIGERFPDLNIDFDMDETNLPYPIGHTVLRIEGESFDPNKIILIAIKLKLLCEIMEDSISIKTTHNKVCN
ncbi:hypothetical protein [uncultured Psychroserpens sp.]|uniref:hypothetical protein n=1 Tax=uncultured Psychroserpens sp. TaxID=255436 RepID=UPI00262C8EE3|nr:hypothetical protein [uncultured Psychroserpens sp.]